MIRRAYVGAIRALRRALSALGVLGWLERRGTPRARWLRSLFSIYDLAELSRLDLAWWSFGALAATEKYLAQGAPKRVFEYGSGASTLWLARRAAQVVSVEHDPHWYELVRAHTATPGHVDLRLVPAAASGSIASAKSGFAGQYFDAYVAAIRDAGGPFDVIVIDGRAREACLTEAAAHLAPGGIILMDDTIRRRYRDAMDASGLAQLPFGGRAACLPYPSSTTLLARDAATLHPLIPD